MLDPNVVITIVPAIATAIFAYLVAHKRNTITERLNRAKLDAETQNQALAIVRGVMTDMQNYFHKEMEILRGDNEKLRQQLEENKETLNVLKQQLIESDELVRSLRSEIATLKKALVIYEDEIARLRKG